jgi:hypothetical protein
MEIPLVTITCFWCGAVQAEFQFHVKPKRIAKQYGWKHNMVKGFWVCPKCQNVEYDDVKKLS